MEKLRYSRVLLKLSGEALAGEQKFGIEPKASGIFCGEIAAVASMGVQVALMWSTCGPLGTPDSSFTES